MHPNLRALHQHSDEFRKEVIRVTDRIFVAVGYAASNVSMILGETGLIIIDTTESTKAASNILTEFRKLTNLPVKTILYTHSHRDHVSGATVFSEGREVEIIARKNFDPDLTPVQGQTPRPSKHMLDRTRRQFGIGLNSSERVNLGLGPGDRPTEGMGAGFLMPNHWIGEQPETLERDGVTLELHPAPGETEDHVVVWLAKERILFSGDNFYKSFPNLYAIRGTRYRDFDIWADTLEKLAEFGAELMIPGHSRPVRGKGEVSERLHDYAAAIRQIIRQTVEGMNQGLGLEEIARKVQLPDSLAAKPWLKEFYGTVEWAVKAYFVGNVGWFDGNPTRLFPLPLSEKAEVLVRLAGGEAAVWDEVNLAQQQGKHQLVLELLELLEGVEADPIRVTEAKLLAFRVLADQQINATARNYYLSCAKELEAGIVQKASDTQ